MNILKIAQFPSLTQAGSAQPSGASADPQGRAAGLRARGLTGVQLEHELDRVVEVASPDDLNEEEGTGLRTWDTAMAALSCRKTAEKRGGRSLNGDHQCGAYSGHRSRDRPREDSWPSPEDRAMAWVPGPISPAGQRPTPRLGTGASFEACRMDPRC